jgi:hypothetical protein
MYSKKAWGGPVDPFILVNFLNSTQKSSSDSVISLVVYEWKDEDLIGVWPSPDASEASLLEMLPLQQRLMWVSKLEKMGVR